ncbi:antitoxin VbhA family protein [Streptacidiphilus sp. BW17]|uniref:antitoxin VbhA family protein n=1 Tax=Streptacidiphilus sp. BW17 TaxID=3156274 RepID=UPI003514AC3E
MGSEISQRRAAVKPAQGSLAAEGLAPSAEESADAEAYVKGELSADEMVERALSRHRPTPDRLVG